MLTRNYDRPSPDHQAGLGNLAFDPQPRPVMECRRELKYCEICGITFIRLPHTGIRICPGCTYKAAVRQEQEEKKLQEISTECKNNVIKFRRRGAEHEKGVPCRGRWARWRAPLVALFESKKELSSREIGNVVGCCGSAAVCRARNSGLNLKVIGYQNPESKRGAIYILITS